MFITQVVKQQDYGKILNRNVKTLYVTVKNCIRYFAVMQHLGIFDILQKINLGIFDNFSKNFLYSVSGSNLALPFRPLQSVLCVPQSRSGAAGSGCFGFFYVFFVCLKSLDSEYNIFLKMMVL